MDLAWAPCRRGGAEVVRAAAPDDGTVHRSACLGDRQAEQHRRRARNEKLAWIIRASRAAIRAGAFDEGYAVVRSGEGNAEAPWCAGTAARGLKTLGPISHVIPDGFTMEINAQLEQPFRDGRVLSVRQDVPPRCRSTIGAWRPTALRHRARRQSHRRRQPRHSRASTRCPRCRRPRARRRRSHSSCRHGQPRRRHAEGNGVAAGDTASPRRRLGIPSGPNGTCVEVGPTRDGGPVHLAAEAESADGIIASAASRRTPASAARVERGVVKMSRRGLGKREGDAAFHRARTPGTPARRRDRLRAKRARPFSGRRGPAEDQHHALAQVVALRAEEMMEREPAILKKAGAHGPPAGARIDLLIVDAIGKKISGVGMDPNVTGRGSAGEDGPGRPRTSHRGSLFARELTPETTAKPAESAWTTSPPRLVGHGSRGDVYECA